MSQFIILVCFFRVYTQGARSELGFVDKEKVWNWVVKYDSEMKREKWNGKVNGSGRKDLWFGIGVELGFKNKLYKGLEINKGLRLVGNKWWGGEDWNSVLFLKYEEGVELKDHVDRKVFNNKVVVVNISKDSFLGENVEFNYGGKLEVLSNGEVIEFNNQVVHGVRRVESERWSLSFRKVLM